MELTNRFRVAVPIAEAWALLTDVERIAPCLPGAQLTEIEGDEYRGVVKVKVGPITAQYRGVARFVERDEGTHRAVLRAEGRETRGQGNAAATVSAQLTSDGDGTEVAVVTDLTITGKVAQFGRGVLADVSTKLLDQFVSSLESQLAAGSNGHGGPEASSAGAAAAKDPSPEVRHIDSPEAEPVDLLDAAGAPVFRRAAPLLAGFAIAWFVLRVLRKRKNR